MSPDVLNALFLMSPYLKFFLLKHFASSFLLPPIGFSLLSSIVFSAACVQLLWSSVCVCVCVFCFKSVAFKISVVMRVSMESEAAAVSDVREIQSRRRESSARVAAIKQVS